MASLKYHLLREVADNIFHDSAIWYENTPTLFLLAGKEQLLIVRRMIQNEVITVRPYGDELEAKYGEQAILCKFLTILLAKWARKLIVFSYNRFYDWNFSWWKNEDLTELSIDKTSIGNWLEVFKMFPNIVFLNLTAFQFHDVLRAAPNELAGLEEIGITFENGFEMRFESFSDICIALGEHQSKFPALEVVHLKEVDLARRFYPDASAITGIPSVKHLKIAASHEHSSFDITLLTTMQKLFPSLETLDMNVEAYIFERFHFENINKFYEAFQSLSVGFDLTINYRQKLRACFVRLTDIRKFLATKGLFIEKYGNLTVRTCFPGKIFIHEVCEVPTFP